VPLVAPLRPILALTDGGLVTQLYRIMGGAPKPIVRRAFQLSSGTKVLTKPIAKLQHLDDREWLAQIEAVDRFSKNMIAYPGRTFGQVYHRMVKKNQLRNGVVHYDGREIRVDAITLPVLIFAGNTDGIAPVKSVKPLVRLLPNAHEVRFEIVPGGHLGMLTGRAARRTTWVIMDEWISQHSRPDPAEARPRTKAAKKTTRKAPPKKAVAKGTDVAPQRSTIGSNPERRFASQSSRNLSRKP
jgi:polyhydroxyalkanoate synthase